MSVDYWAWVNNSGTHIYKYAGSGYEKVREAHLSIDIKRERDEQILFTSGHIGEAPPMQFTGLSYEISEGVVTFGYDFTQNYYNPEPTEELYQENYNVVSVDLHTGDNISFVAESGNLMETYDLNNTLGDTLQTGIMVDFSAAPSIPSFFKLRPYDTIGSGVLVNANEELGDIEIKPATKSQVSIVNLDDAYHGNTNCISIDFKFQHLVPPVVTFGLSYTGQSDNMSYLGAMIKGSPTISSVDFILTEVPPDTGYCLYVHSSTS